MQTYTVTKTVEYQYTVVAESVEAAEKLAVNYGTIEANQWTNLDIVAESNEEYEQSLEG
jgi:hypothetical protein